MLPRSPLGALQFGGAAEDESESLQADVMRFMAILGLCLMVIFALVQSLPSVGETREQVREQEAERAAHRVEIAELREQLSILSNNNRQIQAQLEQNEKTIEELKITDTDTVELQSRLYEYEQTIETQNARLQLNTAIEVQIRELDQQRDQLQSENQRLVQQLQVQQTTVQAQSSEIAALESRLAESQSAPTVQESQLAPVPVTEPEPVLVTEPAPEPAPEPSEAEGFRLTFASNDAFFSLVRNGEIDVFVITPQNEGYQLARSGQELLPSPLPRQVQDINTASLPSSLLSILSRQRLSTSSRWGVVLSARVMQGIDQARAGARGGTLSIDSTADVILK